MGFGFILFVKADREIATGGAKRVEEIGVAAVVVVHIFHGSNLSQTGRSARIIFDFFLIYFSMSERFPLTPAEPAFMRVCGRDGLRASVYQGLRAIAPGYPPPNFSNFGCPFRPKRRGGLKIHSPQQKYIKLN